MKFFYYKNLTNFQQKKLEANILTTWQNLCILFGCQHQDYAIVVEVMDSIFIINNSGL